MKLSIWVGKGTFAGLKDLGYISANENRLRVDTRHEFQSIGDHIGLFYLACCQSADATCVQNIILLDHIYMIEHLQSFGLEMGMVGCHLFFSPHWAMLLLDNRAPLLAL